MDDVISIELLSETDTDFFGKVVRPDLVAASINNANIFANLPAIVSEKHVREDAERARPNIWDQHPRTEEDVLDAISGAGSYRFKTYRNLGIDLHDPFRKLLRNAIGEDGYSASMPSESRAMKVMTWMSVPLIHLRRLDGQRQATRGFHLRSQLIGNVCTPTVLVKPTPPRLPREASDAFQVATRRVAQTMKHAIEGNVSTANKTLNRPEAPSKPIDETYENLCKLHPDGAPPMNIVLPAVPLYSKDSVSVEAVRKIVQGCSTKETSPGPSQWTFELLHIALGDAFNAECFRNVIIDICNGALPDFVDLALSASNILGIPKENGSERPIAMGETFLKVAASVSMAREYKNLVNAFRHSQFGVATPGGADLIVHHVRSFVCAGIRPFSSEVAGVGRVVWTLDGSNAFNTPARQGMYDNILKYKCHGLLGVFKVGMRSHALSLVVEDCPCID